MVDSHCNSHGKVGSNMSSAELSLKLGWWAVQNSRGIHWDWDLCYLVLHPRPVHTGAGLHQSFQQRANPGMDGWVMGKYQQAPTERWELVQSLRKHGWEWAVVLTATEGAVITHWDYYPRMWVTGKICERTRTVGSREESPASPEAMGDRWKGQLDLSDLQASFSRRVRKRDEPGGTALAHR